MWGIVANRWQTGSGGSGVLLGAQFERYYSGGYQVSTNSYADVTNLFDVDGDGATGGSGDTVTMPTQVRPRYETGNRVRSGFYGAVQWRSEEHTSELQSLMRISYAVLCLKKKKNTT